jgi:dTDP-4-dehydrorhamnose 3,5-epimerase
MELFMLKVTPGKFEGIFIIKPDVFEDDRGFFYESYNSVKLGNHGIIPQFIQDNHSRSIKGTLRGLHYQINPGQDKLVRVTLGEVFDVVVDIRHGSPTFGQWESFVLSDINKLQLFVPKGFAHGFCVLSEWAEFQYKCSEYWSPPDERGICWNDPEIGVEWPISDPLLSAKDQRNSRLSEHKPYFKI